MKMKKILASILALVISVSIVSLPASAIDVNAVDKELNTTVYLIGCYIAQLKLNNSDILDIAFKASDSNSPSIGNAIDIAQELVKQLNDIDLKHLNPNRFTPVDSINKGAIEASKSIANKILNEENSIDVIIKAIYDLRDSQLSWYAI